MEIKWENFFIIVEKPNWFLLYQNSMTAIMISKKDMSTSDINVLRDFLKNIKDVPIELIAFSKLSPPAVSYK